MTPPEAGLLAWDAQFDSRFGNRTGVRNLLRAQSRFAETGRGCYI